MQCIECKRSNGLKKLIQDRFCSVFCVNRYTDRHRVLPKTRKQKQKERRRLKAKQPKKKIHLINLYSKNNRSKWLHLRMEVFRKYGKECMCCGAIKGPMHVDHIKPKSLYPELTWDFNNLQVLCEDCNMGKGNLFEDDWRTKS